MAAKKIVSFYRLVKHSKGAMAGQSFELSDWQVFWVSVITLITCFNSGLLFTMRCASSNTSLAWSLFVAALYISAPASLSKIIM
jgi:hypothetical protein